MPLSSSERVQIMLFLSKKLPKNCFTKRTLVVYSLLFEFIQRFQQYFKTMQYSFSFDQHISSSPLHPQHTALKTFSSLRQTTVFELISHSQLRLSQFINPNQQQCLMQIRPETIIKLDDKIDFGRYRCLWAGQDEWIVVQQKPIKIYMILNKYRKFVPVILSEQLNLQEICCYFSYPQVAIYGHNPQTFTNHLYSINVNTLEIKQLTNNKDYSPTHRNGYWAYFTEGRLYLFGGKDIKGSSCSSLFWTYNLENGNWFALDLDHYGFNLTSKSLSLQIQAGKVLSIENGKMFIVQLYQSRVKQAVGYDQSLTADILCGVEGLFIHQGYIYLHSNGKLFDCRLKLIKTKMAK